MKLDDINPRRWAIALIFVTAWILACKGCEKTPVPDDRSEWVGTWVNDETGSEVEIEQEGSCNYEWREGSSTRSVSGGASRWEDNTFFCAAIFDSEFSIDEPPRQQNGSWELKLEGQRFQKVDR